MAAPMAGQVPVPPAQSGQQIPAPPQPQPSQTQTQVDIDPIAKVKQLLLPRLKESLVTLMKVSGQILHQNSLAEEGMSHKTSEGLQQQHERCLEEFYSICDQLEINLRLALEMQSQQSDSAKYTPLPVSIPKHDASIAEHQSVPYPQYFITVKQQIACAKDMYELLTEFTKKLMTER